MGQIRYKLQNILLEYSRLPEECRPMLYRGDTFGYDKLLSAHTLRPGQTADFLTYFNACSAAKWYRCTVIDNLSLTLTCQGDFRVQLFGGAMDGGVVEKEYTETIEYHLCDKTTVSLSVPAHLRNMVVGFRLTIPDADTTTEEKSLLPFRLYEGSWTTLIDNHLVRDVRIALTAVTFHREVSITHTMSLLERELFYADEPAGQHIRMRVIDNGNTLDPDEWNSNYIELVPHENTGSAGGFARGMQAALTDTHFCPTHILLMEDDVQVWPEAFVRTYALLSLLRHDYEKHFICGAMFCAGRRNIQQETLGFVQDNGANGSYGAGYDMNTAAAVLQNEQDAPLPCHAYAGWRYCCIPLPQTDHERLPLPLFMKWTDTAYSLSHKAEFLTLNGICFWHKDRSARFNACRELYLWYRNALISQAVYGICEEIDFIRRIDTLFWQELSRLSYINAELLLDAIEDFCRQPSFVLSPQGDALLQEHTAKKEIMWPIDSMYRRHIPIDYTTIYRKSPATLTQKEQRRYDNTCNGQTLSPAALKDTVAVIAYDTFDDPAKQYMAKEMLAVNPFNRTACLRTRDNARFKALVTRHKRLLTFYFIHKEDIIAEWALAGSSS